MDRKEVYAIIKEHNLQNAINEEYGNWTRVTTQKLAEFIYNYDCTLIECPYEDEDRVAEAKKALEEEIEKAVEQKNAPAEIDNPYEAACIAFVGILKDNGLLEDILDKL